MTFDTKDKIILGIVSLLLIVVVVGAIYIKLQQTKNQKEIIDLRLMSSLTSLKQLQIDFARIKGIYSQEDNSSIRSFEETSKDLSNYVENIKNSYRNLERELEY